MDDILRALTAVHSTLNIPVMTDVAMKNHTSFKIGGAVRAMFFPSCESGVSDLLAVLNGHGVSPLIIGNGTNLLVSDGPLNIVVIKTTGIDNISLGAGDTIETGGGVLLSRLAVFALEHGLEGLEFAHGIPGTLGGAVSMNAGAYGGEIKDTVFRTQVLTAQNERIAITGDEHQFSYRRSRFTGSGEIILSSELRLKQGDPVCIRRRMDELSRRRRESQPLSVPSAGSTFKRPKTGYAAALIEQAGLKGYAVGGARVSEKHAGFVVNGGGASFSDVFAVMEHVRETVLQKFGVELEPEVKIIRG